MGFPGRRITKTFHEGIVGNPKCTLSAAEIADVIGCSTSTLYAKLRPIPREDGKTPEILSVDEGVEVMRAIGHHGPLYAMAAELGFEIRPGTATPNRETIFEEMRETVGHLSAYQQAMDEGQDIDAVLQLKQDLIREIEETYTKYVELKG